jgi:hypothetical protein
MRTFGIDGHDWHVSQSREIFLVTEGDTWWHFEAPEFAGVLPLIVREPDDVDSWATRCAQEAVLRFIAER